MCKDIIYYQFILLTDFMIFKNKGVILFKKEY